MAKKKKSVIPVTRRNREKIKLACRQFDRCIIIYLILVALCVLAVWNGSYQLAKPDADGFIWWFLLVPSYLPLWLVSLFKVITGVNFVFDGNEALSLGLCDVFMAIMVHLFVRFWGSRRGPFFIRDARVFLLIFIFWGVFQLVCWGVWQVWSMGGAGTLHS